MAETHPKRLREEQEQEFDSNSKRQKPLNNDILNNLLEEPSHEPSYELSQEDLSAIFTTLEQELSSDDFESQPCTDAELSNGDEDVKSVMRHLLEASDDELGIPCSAGDENDHNENNNNNENVGINNYEEINFPFNDFHDTNGLWEFEDETANYYTVLQSELFM